jgi:hypothetical protein
MQNKFSKKLGIMIIAILTISTIATAIPFASATITNRPTVYRADGTTAAPVTIEAGTIANIDTFGMTITGAQVWLWLSTSGGSEINIALGDRPYAGPFLLSELVDTVTPHTYTFNPAALAGLCSMISADSPFAGEGRTYAYTIGNSWINGTIPLKVQGEDVDYWIKVVDVTPNDVIAGSEIGVSTNRVHFTPGFDATPLSGAPETEVWVSGYALNASSNCSITTENGAFTFVRTHVYPSTNDEGGWVWTGWETAFNIEDLENKVVFGDVPPMSHDINITVWELNTGTPDFYESWNFTQYYREVYLEPPTFRGDTGDYSLALTLETGGEYVIDMEYFPAFGTVSIYLGSALIAADVPLNQSGGFRSPWTVPALTTGNYVFSVIDNNDVAYNFTVAVLMVPYIYCTPDSGHVGDTFVVTGVNFLDYVDDYVTIYFENSVASPYFTMMLNFTVASSTWTSAVLTVPQAWGGECLVEARIVDGTTVIADDIYTVIPMLHVMDNDTCIINDCSIVEVVGTGFYREVIGETINDWFIYIDNSLYMGDSEDWGLGVNATGYVVTEFVAAGFRPGLHVISAILDVEGTGGVDWQVGAKDCFFVCTEGDPIADMVTEMNMTITALDGTIATLSTTIGDMQVDLAEVHAVITSVSGDVATIKTDVGTMKTSLTSLSASISSVSSGMATLQTSIGSVQTSLASIDAVIGSMYGDLLTIDTTIGSFETTLNSIDASVSGLDSDVAALGSDMDGLVGDVASIDTVLGSVAGTVTAMEGTLATIETDLGTVQVDLASAKTDIAAVETDVNDNLPVDMMPVWIAVVLALIAAIGSIAGVFIIQRKIA